MPNLILDDGAEAPTALVTGCDRGLGLAIARRLAMDGWRVFAGSYLPDWPELTALASEFPDSVVPAALDIASGNSVKEAAAKVGEACGRLDVVINNAGVNSPLKDRKISEMLDYDDMMRTFNVNALGALRVVEHFLPLTATSSMKRLCFVSSEAGSIENCGREAWFGYCMSKSALNMGVRILFNALRPDGYTFRLYHPGWIKSYMSGTKGTVGDLEPDEAAALALPYFLNPLSDDAEDRLIMRDCDGREWPW